MPAEQSRPAPPGRVVLIGVLMVLSLVAWRKQDYYSGGLDPVVVGKALLSVTALALAADAVLRVRRSPIPARTPLFVCAYVVIGLFGGWAAGSLPATMVLSVRLVIVAATMVLLTTAYPVLTAARGLFVAMAGVGGLCALTGAGSYLSSGRLEGGVLPLNPNDIAILFGPPLLWLCLKVLSGRRSRYDVAGLVLLVALTWTTGSRAGLAAVAVGALVLMIRVRRIPPGLFVAGVGVIATVLIVLISTDVLAAYFGRGGLHNLQTLNSRTIAWRAAFSLPKDGWRTWFGAGPSVKQVPVLGQYWNAQVLDSSWVSAYVQAGILGMAVLGLWAVSVLSATFRYRGPENPLWIALAVYALITSVVENGLLDSAVLFVVFFLAAAAGERGAAQPLSSAASIRSRSAASAALSAPRAVTLSRQ